MHTKTVLELRPHLDKHEILLYLGFLMLRKKNKCQSRYHPDEQLPRAEKLIVNICRSIIWPSNVVISVDDFQVFKSGKGPLLAFQKRSHTRTSPTPPTPSPNSLRPLSTCGPEIIGCKMINRLMLKHLPHRLTGVCLTI